ncbi:MAG TPA: DUF3592 domain-containing protein [Thermoanaerobaculia bacterium]|nr:DUF3592 domain-containing protein [Thermoanaerobaculia bacterium]
MAAFRITTRTTTGGSPSVVGKLTGSLFFLVFAALGLGLGGFFAATLWRGAASWRWEPAQCRVLGASVKEQLFTLPPAEAAATADAYALSVTYQWDRHGRTYGGDHLGSGGGYRSYGEAAKAAALYPPGAMVRCYVDPANPAAAVLRRPALWAFALLGVPLLFAAFGIGGVVTLWRRGRRPPAGASAPRSQRTRKGAGRGCAVAVFGVFALFGAGFMVPFAFPLARYLGSRDWVQAPATIVWSGVGAHSGSDSTTYSVDMLYEYEHGGRRYRANRYNFSIGSSSGREGKEAVVAGLPAGAQTAAWVDPRDPSVAVLDRTLGSFIWFSLIPGVFVLIGVVGMTASLLAGRRKAAGLDWLPSGAAAGGGAASTSTALAGGGSVRELAAAPGTSGALSAAGVPAGPLTLRPGKSRVGSFVALLFAALFWNGIVSVFLVSMRSEGKLFHDGCATLFLVPFVLVGIGLLLSVPYGFLAMFNPRVEVTLSTPLGPGAAVALAWRFTGASGRMRRLVLMVEGREEATYRRGTDTTTVKRTFARLVAFDSDDPARMPQGETLVLLPPDTMHSFQSSHNKVTWTLVVHGDIPRWPDISDEAALTVYPAALLAGGGTPS